MSPKFHIFRRTATRSSIWIAAVNGISEARRFLAKRRDSSGEEYFLYDARAEKFITEFRPVFHSRTRTAQAK